MSPLTGDLGGTHLCSGQVLQAFPNHNTNTRACAIRVGEGSAAERGFIRLPRPLVHQHTTSAYNVLRTNDPIATHACFDQTAIILAIIVDDVVRRLTARHAAPTAFSIISDVRVCLYNACSLPYHITTAVGRVSAHRRKPNALQQRGVHRSKEEPSRSPAVMYHVAVCSELNGVFCRLGNFPFIMHAFFFFVGMFRLILARQFPPPRLKVRHVLRSASVRGVLVYTFFAVHFSLHLQPTEVTQEGVEGGSLVNELLCLPDLPPSSAGLNFDRE